MLQAVMITLAVAQPISEEVTFKGAGGLELKGTFTRPADEAKHAAVLLLPGSGPTDRDGNSPKLGFVTNLLKDVAERLASDGVASLRFDKRATAGYAALWPKNIADAGDFFSWENFVGDAAAGLEFLRARPEVEAAKVGLVGHSEGALIGLQLASTPDKAPAALVLMAGAGRPLDQVLTDQLNARLPEQLPKDQVKTYLDYARKAIAEVKAKGTVPPNTPQGLVPLFNPTTLKLLRSYFTIDPAVLAKAYSGAVLVVNGANDNQVSATKDAKRLKEALSKRKGAVSDLVIIPSASHNFKFAISDKDSNFQGPVIPQTLDAISAWLQQHLAK